MVLYKATSQIRRNVIWDMKYSSVVFRSVGVQIGEGGGDVFLFGERGWCYSLFWKEYFTFYKIERQYE